jgi:ribosomal protein L31
MTDSYSYGKLYYNKYDYSGEWIKSVIKQISNLQFFFDIPSNHLPNGIDINTINTQNIKIENNNLIGKDIAQFIVSSYITRYDALQGCGEEYFTIQSVVNIVLLYINRKSEERIDRKVIECIITILNHPHFYGSQNIDDIHKKISTVDNLNDRFKHSNETTSEKENVIISPSNTDQLPQGQGGWRPPHNMFFD